MSRISVRAIKSKRLRKLYCIGAHRHSFLRKNPDSGERCSPLVTRASEYFPGPYRFLGYVRARYATWLGDDCRQFSTKAQTVMTSSYLLLSSISSISKIIYYTVPTKYIIAVKYYNIVCRYSTYVVATSCHKWWNSIYSLYIRPYAVYL